MSWSVNVILLFLFVYTTAGIPLNDNPEEKQTLRIRSLIPSQWGKDSEISYHWPKGEVPYVFDDKSYDDGVKARVRIVMAALERDSCMRFKEQKGDGNGSWLHFTNPGMQRQCFHNPSYEADGEIQVILGYDCLRQPNIMHSVLHGVGFRDEVSHPQRDLFVKMMWGNIQSDYKSLFRIQPVDKAGGLVEYDPRSIMHFHDRAYSKNGQATITPLLPGLRIAPSNKLSHLDKMKLRIMFGHECNKRKVGEVLNKCKSVLLQYDKAELTPPAKPENGNSANKEDAEGDPRGNPEVDPNAPSGNNDGGQKGFGDGLQEVIVVGNDVASGNTNNKGDVEDNQNDNLENVDSVAVNEDDDTMNNKDSKQPSEVIIVGNEQEGGDISDENNKDPEENNEAIIVGNDDNKKSPGTEDLRGKKKYNVG